MICLSPFWIWIKGEKGRWYKAGLWNPSPRQPPKKEIINVPLPFLITLHHFPENLSVFKSTKQPPVEHRGPLIDSLIGPFLLEQPWLIICFFLGAWTNSSHCTHSEYKRPPLVGHLYIIYFKTLSLIRVSSLDFSLSLVNLFCCF